MITSLPRLREPKGGNILLRLASNRRKKISQVGKVFPKTSVQELVDEKLDFHCVGLEKDKNVSFPVVNVEGPPSSPGTEGRVLTPSLEPGEITEVTLPVLPSVQGSRRGSCSVSSDISEPLDFLIEGESRKKSETDISLDTSELVPEKTQEEVMRCNLEPLIDKLFEEDELFVQDFEDAGLNCVLFIRKMGIHVELKTKDYMAGIICTPLFHCPRCRDHWAEFGTVPEDCKFKRQPTRGPAIHMARGRKPRVKHRKKKMKKKLGDIKEGSILDQMDENESDENTSRSSANPDSGKTASLQDGASHHYLASGDVVLEDLRLGVIDSGTKTEALKVFRREEKMTDKEYIRRLSDAFGFDEEQYHNFARLNMNVDMKDIAEEDLDNETSVISRLDLSVLDKMTVKDLPEKFRLKLLSMLRLQRQRKRRQMKVLANKKKTAGHDTEIGNEGDTDQETDDEDTGNVHSNDNRRNSAVKRNRKRRDSQGKSGKVRASGGSVEDITDKESAERESGYTEGHHRDSSAHKESQSRRRSRQMNNAVKTRSGQPDTPFQRPGRHPITLPSNSSSLFACGDGDSDEETWGQGRSMSRVGSSRPRVSDSGLSYMSEMARGGHVTDSKTSILRTYSRTTGSARARMSHSNLEDQSSYGSLGNAGSIYDLEDGQSVIRPNSMRARRQIKKKEKGDGMKRPGNYYHSRVIDDLGQVTASFVDTSMTYESKARLSNAHVSLTDLPSPCRSTVWIKRSVKEFSQKKKEETETEILQIELLPQVNHQEPEENSQNCSESMDQVPALESPSQEVEISQISGTTFPTQAQEKPKLLFKRAIQEKRKPLVTLEDLNVIHRLPVSSAFTYSFYELPNQYREHNESIKKAAGRIACRKKKESDHFRSRSVP